MIIVAYITVTNSTNHSNNTDVPAIISPAQALVVSLTVNKGDTMSSLLKDQNIHPTEVNSIIESMKSVFSPAELWIGETLTIEFEEGTNEELKEVKKLVIDVDYGKKVTVIRAEDGSFASQEIITPLEKRMVRVGGEISSSLYNTASELGIPTGSLNDLVGALSYDVDFQREIKTGNSFNVFYEKYYDPDGTFSHDGNILYATLDLGNRQITLYRYTDGQGNVGYYDSEGRSVKKDLLKTPLSVAKISSKFGNRKHPILGYTKFHKGVDFAAPIGTPIYAAGKGTIEEIGHKGAYGNYIRIRHNSEYSTAYAHISRFAKNMKKGAYVPQGTVIAYVGSTGRATGPHLHYEVLNHGKQVNPLDLKLQPSIKLDAKELANFALYSKEMNKMADETPMQTEISYGKVSQIIRMQL